MAVSFISDPVNILIKEFAYLFMTAEMKILMVSKICYQAGKGVNKYICIGDYTLILAVFNLMDCHLIALTNYLSTIPTIVI